MTDRTELRRLLDEGRGLRQYRRDHYSRCPCRDCEALRAAYMRWRVSVPVVKLTAVLDQLDAAEAALARVRKLHGGWSSQADFNAEMGGDFWRGMTIKGRECADELRRAVGGGEQS